MTRFAGSFCVVTALAMFLNGAAANADKFGSGANSFEIEFVPIINPDGPAGEHVCCRGGGVLPGNRPDNPSSGNIGSVAYDYRIGKFEISEAMIDAANAVGGLGITKDTRGSDKPATSITWFEAAQFVNWLNISTGSLPAYKFDVGGSFQLWEPADAGYDADNLFRNTRAKYFLPSADEWHKAAYYDPTTLNGTWYDYPTGSDAPPTAVTNGTESGTAVYQQSIATGPSDITQAGGLSPYGTMAQGGNVSEWEETAFNRLNVDPLALRGRRGGHWEFSSLAAADRSNGQPEISTPMTGFRVASAVPEPSAFALCFLASLLFLIPNYRIRKRDCIRFIS